MQEAIRLPRAIQFYFQEFLRIVHAVANSLCMLQIATGINTTSETVAKFANGVKFAIGAP
jgi:hypothetical protein